MECEHLKLVRCADGVLRCMDCGAELERPEGLELGGRRPLPSQPSAVPPSPEGEGHGGRAVDSHEGEGLKPAKRKGRKAKAD